MNYIDIALIGLLALSLIFGLIGKLHKKIRFLIGTLISLPLAYLIASIMEKSPLLYSITNKIIVKLNISGIVERSESLRLIFMSSVQFVLFYVSFLLLVFIFVPILLGLLTAIIAPKKKRQNSKYFNKKAVFSFGLIQLVSSIIILAYFVLPVALLKPALNNFDENREQIGVSFDTTTINDMVQNSVFINIESNLLENNYMPFLSYKQTIGEETIKFTYYEDFNDIAMLVDGLPSILKIASNLNLSMDLNDSSAIEEKIESFGEILGTIDDIRSNLSTNSKINKAFAEFIESYVNPGEDDNTSIEFLQYAKPYLNSFNFSNDSYKDKLLAIIIQAYIDSIETETRFAVYIDVTQYNFDELKTELSKLPQLVNLFGSKKNVSKEQVKATLTSSDLAAQVVTGLLSDYYTDNSVTKDNLDYDKESEALALALNYSNSNDNSTLDQFLLVNSFSESDLLAAIIDFYTRTGNPFEIKVDLAKKTAITLLFDAKKANGELTEKQYQTYMGMFIVE